MILIARPVTILVVKKVNREENSYTKKSLNEQSKSFSVPAK